MRSMFKRASAQTREEKLSAVDGLNLFFGALLGANLGTLDRMPLDEYGALIVMLAFSVAVIRAFSTFEERRKAWTLLLMYAIFMGGLLFAPPLQPEGAAPADLHRIGVTLAVWIATVLLFELSPHREPAQASPSGDGQVAP